MKPDQPTSPTLNSRLRAGAWALAAGLVVGATACASSGTTSSQMAPTARQVLPFSQLSAPSPDPRIGLAPGLMDAEEAIWNMRKVSSTPPPPDFLGVTNSDLAFTGDYAIQGNYNGFQVWDISTPAAPSLVVAFVCPASQSDVSVFENLLFVSGEGLGGRLDCGVEGVPSAVSADRLRGIRIFDISDIRNPRYVANVQTCRGSHTHTVLEHPGDDENVYIYVSGSAPVRPADELPGCVSAMPGEDPNSALFRIEVIRVPLADPHVGRDRQLAPYLRGSRGAADARALSGRPRGARARAGRGRVHRRDHGRSMVMPEQAVQGLLGQLVQQRGGTGAPTAADSAALRERLPDIVRQMVGAPEGDPDGPEPGPRSATTSPSTRRSGWPAEPVKGTGSCSTSPIP
jgi:hypothetical protein